MLFANKIMPHTFIEESFTLGRYVYITNDISYSI